MHGQSWEGRRLLQMCRANVLSYLVSNCPLSPYLTHQHPISLHLSPFHPSTFLPFHPFHLTSTHPTSSSHPPSHPTPHPGTLAHELLNNPKEIVCQDNRVKPRRCQIEFISFSAHVDYAQVCAVCCVLCAVYCVLWDCVTVCCVCVVCVWCAV